MSIVREGVGVQAISILADEVLVAPYPGGYTAILEHFAVFLCLGKPTAGTVSVPGVPTGYAQQATRRRTGQPLCIVAYTKVLAAGEAAPSIAVPNVDSWANLTTAQLAIYSGVDPSTPLDVASAAADAAAALTWTTPPAVTTATDAAMVVSMVGTPDDNHIGLLAGSEQGFSLAMGGDSYDTTTGTDGAIGMADKIQASLGLVTMPTWEETQVGTDPWVGITLALRPIVAAGAAPNKLHQVVARGAVHRASRW